MSETKHTPGPWSVTGKQFSGSVRVSAGSGSDLNGLVAICDAGDYARSKVEGAANARLIAAAPELLEALVWMVANDDTNEADEGNAYWVDGLHRARAAIAKATGEKP